MNILLLGSGGREHALAWKIAASPLVERLYCAPGNAGIAQEAEIVGLDVADHAAVIAFCQAQKIDLVVVGPEGPLCAGIVDDLEAAGIKAFGPSKAAARLEGSKGFTKDLCEANAIPTAASNVLRSYWNRYTWLSAARRLNSPEAGCASRSNRTPAITGGGPGDCDAQISGESTNRGRGYLSLSPCLIASSRSFTLCSLEPVKYCSAAPKLSWGTTRTST